MNAEVKWFVVGQLLNENFPHRPLRSPVLTPFEFFLWCHSEFKIYASRPESLHELRNCRIDELQKVTLKILRNVKQHFEQNSLDYMETNGGYL